MVKIPMPYFEKLCKAGALHYMDGIAVHPYMPTPEGVEKEVAAMVAMTKKYNNGQAKPIWVTECGTWADRSVERAVSARYLVRLYTLLLTQAEVAHIDWFLVCDYAEFKFQGLFHCDKDPMGRFTPVVLYPAYANLVQQLHHTQFVRQPATDPRTRVYQFQRQDEFIWTCWSTFEKAGLTFTAKSPVRLIDLVGGEKQLTPVNGQITVTADESPVYVRAGKGVVTAVAEMPRPDQVIADSATDFAGEQGKGHWSYHYFGSDKTGSVPYVPADVKPMVWTPSPGDWEDRWFGPAQWFCVSQNATSPGVFSGGQGWPIRRWTSDRSGPVHILGRVDRTEKKGDGVGVKVFLDGTEIFSKMLPPQTATDIDLNATVHEQSRLDFVVTPGPGLDSSYDSTSFHVAILTQPK